MYLLSINGNGGILITDNFFFVFGYLKKNWATKFTDFIKGRLFTQFLTVAGQL